LAIDDKNVETMQQFFSFEFWQMLQKCTTAALPVVAVFCRIACGGAVKLEGGQLLLLPSLLIETLLKLSAKNTTRHIAAFFIRVVRDSCRFFASFSMMMRR